LRINADVANTIREALTAIPAALLDPLIESYEATLAGAQSGDWEKVGLNAGKICEITYKILRSHIDGQIQDMPGPGNLRDACLGLENSPAAFPRSVRIQVPRVLVAVYEMRNNRGIGHAGGDVRPNGMDGEFLLRAIQWIVAELVRVFHNVGVVTAQQIVETVSEKQLPIIWSDGATIRVLRPELRTTDKVLLVLYNEAAKVQVQALMRHVDWEEGFGRFGAHVLEPLHKEAMIHCEDGALRGDYISLALTRLRGKALPGVVILPPGIERVEKVLLSTKKGTYRADIFS
jgi:hypothetical protein